MCTWVSACSKGDGRLVWFPKLKRDLIAAGGLKCPAGNVIDDPDSHSQICAFYRLNPDAVNKYEFRPLDRQFIIDQINATHDAVQIEAKMRHINYRRIAPPELIFKPIVLPFSLPKGTPTKRDLELLREWASVRGSVGDSVGGPVWASVRGSVGDSVGDSVWASVWGSVWASVWGSVGDSVGGSAGDSVRGSVWDSVGAYVGSFFCLQRDQWKYTDGIPGQGYPFLSAVRLWESGIVPSSDGLHWRLHSGPDAEVVWEGRL